MSRRALLSVSDKTGLLPLARQLLELGFTLISTGGTAAAIAADGLPVTPVQKVTGFAECLDGRVKTLHPHIHAGLLARRDNPEHLETLRLLGIERIDLVVINLYPFSRTVQRSGVSDDECIENIDIGGPAMLRSAAKNHAAVTVLIDPADYERVLDELRKNQETSWATRRYLAAKVFAHTAAYDARIAEYLSGDKHDGPHSGGMSELQELPR